MKQKIMEEIMQQMLPHLNNAQLQKLQEVMEHSFYNYEISGKTKELEDDSQKLIDAFVYAKRIEGCSEKTLKYYRTTIEAMTERSHWMERPEKIRIFTNFRLSYHQWRKSHSIRN